LLCLLFFGVGQVTIIAGRMTDLLFEERTERADTFKADMVTNLHNGMIFAGQPNPGLFDSFLCQVLVWGQAIDAGEQPVKMVTGKAGFAGQVVQIDGLLKILIDVNLSPDNFLIYVGGDGH
jgi:hypothetical protein